MSTKRIEYVKDLVRFNRSLDVECLKCGHKGRITPVGLMFLNLPSNTPLEVLARKLKCSQCGEKSVSYGPLGR